MSQQRIVIIGATSAIAEHCTRLLVQNNAVDLSLVGRDQTRLARVAADLQVRSPQSTIHVITTDFFDADAIAQCVNDIAGQGPVDIVLIAQGSLPDQAQCQQDLTAVRNALEINGLSPLLFAEAFAGHLSKAARGTLAIIGSVAGDRSRKSSYVYGAAKALVASYTEGLQHRFAGTGVNIVLVKPGPTETPMTLQLRRAGKKLAPTALVAQQIVSGIRSGEHVVYTPGKWALIMWVVRSLPRFIFHRTNF